MAKEVQYLNHMAQGGYVYNCSLIFYNLVFSLEGGLFYFTLQAEDLFKCSSIQVLESREGDMRLKEHIIFTDLS